MWRVAGAAVGSVSSKALTWRVGAGEGGYERGAYASGGAMRYRKMREESAPLARERKAGKEIFNKNIVF